MIDEIIQKAIDEKTKSIEQKVKQIIKSNKQLKQELKYYREQYNNFLSIQKIYMDFIKGLQNIMEANAIDIDFCVKTICEQSEEIAKAYEQIKQEEEEEIDDLEEGNTESNSE